MRINEKVFYNHFTRSDVIKVKIIAKLLDNKEHTPSEIANELHTNTKTILNNCNFLKLIGIIDIDEKKTKRTLYFIKLKSNFNHLSFKESIKKYYQ